MGCESEQRRINEQMPWTVCWSWRPPSSFDKRGERKREISRYTHSHAMDKPNADESKQMSGKDGLSIGESDGKGYGSQRNREEKG